MKTGPDKPETVALVGLRVAESMPTRCRVGLKLAPWIAASVFGSAGLASEQQAWFREAMLGPLAATAFGDQEPKAGLLKLGPAVVNLSPTARLVHSSNVLRVPEESAGWDARYGLAFGTTWRATREQELKLNGEFLQRKTLSGPERDSTQLILEPGSALRYTAYVRDVRVMPFLNLSRTIDPIEAPTVNNTALFIQSSQDLGLQIDWGLHLTTLQLMALSGKKSTASENLDKTRTNRQVYSLRLVRTVSPQIEAGTDYFHVRQDYRNGPARDGAQNNAGVFLRWVLSPRSSLRTVFGHNTFAFEDSRLLGDSERLRAFFGEVQLEQRLSETQRHSLILRRSQSDGVTSNFFHMHEAHYSYDWSLNARARANLGLGQQRVRESLVEGERGRRLRLSTGLTFNLPRRQVLNASFRYLASHSSIPSRAYNERSFECGWRRDF